MRVLVTGAGGFAGPVLIAALQARGHEVHALVRRPAGPRLAPLGVATHQADLLEPGAAVRVLGAVRPGGIVHLAGLAFAPSAEADPEAAYRTNLGATLALLAAVRTATPGARLLMVSSSEIYGAVTPADLPVTEEAPLRPVSVYGASKAAADLAAAQWGRAYGLDVVGVRPFNHTGPGQAPDFVCSALARRVARIETGRQPPVLEVGNVDPVRDFSDVRDIAAGYAALLEGGRSGEAYNLCSGEGVSIAEVIALLRTHARVPLRVRSDPGLRRPADIPRIVGSHAKATRAVGWRPRIPLDVTLGELLDDWRLRVAAERA